MFVLPTTIAPWASSLATTVASNGGRYPSRSREPQRRGEARRMEDVLDRERHTRERRSRGSARERPVQPPRRVERPPFVQREKGVDLRLEGAGALEVCTHHVLGRQLAPRDPPLDLGCAEADRTRHPGRTRGTRKSPSA